MSNFEESQEENKRFDRTLRKLVEVPKEVVKQREEEAKRKGK